MRSMFFVLREGVAVAVDRDTWIREFAKTDRSIAVTEANNGRVSTVFLGLDHGFGTGKPVLFETMVFGGPLDGGCERYADMRGAIDGHARWVERVNGGADDGK